MRDQQEEWLELCRQASVEQDREKLFRLVCRIDPQAPLPRLRSHGQGDGGSIGGQEDDLVAVQIDRKSTRLNSSHT